MANFSRRMPRRKKGDTMRLNAHKSVEHQTSTRGGCSWTAAWMGEQVRRWRLTSKTALSAVSNMPLYPAKSINRVSSLVIVSRAAESVQCEM
jgi:hypothetical protein